MHIVRDLFDNSSLPNSVQCSVCNSIAWTPWECTSCGLFCTHCRPENCWKEHDAIVRVDLHTEVKKTYHNFPASCFMCEFKNTYDNVVKHFNKMHTIKCKCGIELTNETYASHQRECNLICGHTEESVEISTLVPTKLDAQVPTTPVTNNVQNDTSSIISRCDYCQSSTEGQPQDIKYCAKCIKLLQKKAQSEEGPSVTKYDTTHLMKFLISGEEAKPKKTWKDDEEKVFLDRLKVYPINPKTKNNWGYFSVGIQKKGVQRAGTACQIKYWSLVKKNKIAGVSEQSREKRHRRKRSELEQDEAYQQKKKQKIGNEQVPEV